MDPPRRFSTDSQQGGQMSALWDAVRSLESTRATERKDGLERLMDLLRDDKIVKLLDHNQLLSRSKQALGGGRVVLSWTEIFRVAEIALSKEYQAPDSDRTNAKRKQLFGLLHLIISEANRDRNHPMLDPNFLMAHITRFLAHKTIPYAHGQQIITIINQFLSTPSYVSSTRGEDWSHFIKAVTSLIRKDFKPLQPLYEILIQGIIHGSDHPECISVLRTWVVELYKTAITTPATFSEYPILIMDGFLHLARAIAVEARGILCSAGEACISSILRCIQTRDEHDKACELFVVLLKIHASSDSHGHMSFWVENATSWSEIIISLYNYCVEEIRSVAEERKIKKNKEMRKIPKHLLKLAVICTQLMQLKPSDLALVEPPAKKAKTVLAFHQIIQKALQLPGSAEQLAWFRYIGSVLRDYPEILKTENLFGELLTAGANLLTATFIKLEELFLYLRDMLQCERFLVKSGMIGGKSPLWNHIWDILIKSFLVQEPAAQSLELMMDILTYFRPKNIGPFISLYASGNLPLNSSSLQLLQQCLMVCQLPLKLASSSSPLPLDGSCNSLRIAIIRWLLPSPEKDTVWSGDLETLIPQIAFSLLIHRSNQILSNEVGTELVQKKVSDDHEEFEKIFVQCTFKCTEKNQISADEEPVSRRGVKGNITGIFVDTETTVKPLLELLREDLQDVSVIDEKSSNLVKKLHHLIFRVQLYLNLVNLTVKYKVEEGDVEFKDTVLRFLDSSLTKCANYLPGFLASSNRLDGVYAVLRRIHKLLSTEQLCEETKGFIALSFPNALVNTFLAIVQKRFGEAATQNGSDMDMDMSMGASVLIGSSEGDISVADQKELIALEALKCICTYASLDAGARFIDRRCELLAKVLDILLSSSGADISQAYFNLCVEFITRTGRALATVNDRVIVDKVMDLLKCMCQRYHCNFACTTRLWHVFAELTPVIIHWGEEAKFMILVGNLSTLVDKQGIRSSKSYFQLMQTLAKHDPDLTWTHYLPKKAPDSGPKYPLLELHRFFRLSSHMIRLSVIEAICSVFQYAGWVKVDPCLDIEKILRVVENRNMANDDRLKLWFAQIRDALNETFHCPANYTQAEKMEEGVNCVAVVLLCLTKMAFANEYIEQPMLYLLMKTTTERNIMQSLACAALEQAGPADFRKCSKVYAPVNLELLIRNGGLREDIPYTLFNCENKERFYVVYFREIVSNLVVRGEWNDLESLALAMQATSVDLIRRSFCEVFSRLVAKSLAAGNLNAGSTEVLKRRLGGEKALQATARNSLSGLVLAIISNVLEADICWEWDCPGIHLPDFVSVPLNSVQKALDYVEELLGGDLGQTVLLHIATTAPRSIYGILLEFATRVHDAHSTHSLLWRLHHFVLFVDLMLEETKGCFKLVSGYLPHFVIHAYLRFLNLKDGSSHEKRFHRAVLFNLRVFIRRLIAIDSEAMEEFYIIVIRRLTLLASSCMELREGIGNILHLLVTENHEKFAICLSKLDPFPEDEFFRDYGEVAARYQSSLDGEDMLRIIVENAQEDAKMGLTKELLLLVQELLSSNKKLLERLVKQVEGKRFHDECEDDLIHRLLCILIQLINNTDLDPEIRVEASKCLGEIGPVDLSVLVLPPYGRQWNIVRSETAIPQIIRMVAGFLDDEDIRVVTTTMQVMKKLLESPDCAHVLDDGRVLGRKLVKLLAPFKASGFSGVSLRECGVSLDTAEVRSLESKLVVNAEWTHAEWIVNLTCALLDATAAVDTILLRLKPLCALKAEFSEEVFPFVLHTLLTLGKRDFCKLLSRYFRDFFCNFVQISESAPTIDDGITKPASSLYTNKSALRTLLRCVQYLREHPIPVGLTKSERPTPWDNNFWLDVNYFDMAKAAQHCDAYLTSIMLAEIHALRVAQLRETKDRRESRSDSLEDTRSLASSFSLPGSEREKVEKLLVKAYIKIGEPDGVFGCGSARFSDVSSEVQYLESSQAWDEVLHAHDYRVRSDIGVSNALKNLGLFNTCWTQLCGIESQRGGFLDEEVSDIQYECGWRLSQWQINTDKVTYIENEDVKGTLQKLIYESMQGSLNNDVFKFQNGIKRGYNLILDDLKVANLETSENLYGFLSQLQMLRVAEDFGQATQDDILELNKGWKKQHELPAADFKYQEPILSIHKVFLSALEKKWNQVSLTAACDQALEDLVVKARSAGRLELATKYAYELSGTTPAGEIKKQVEIAKNQWAKGKRDIALHIVSSILSRIPHEDSNNTYASLLLLHGEWLFQSLGERPTLISQKFRSACQLYEKNPRSTSEEIAKTYITLGDYADTQYQKLADYIHSELFQQKLEHLKKSHDEQEKLKIHAGNDKDANKTLFFMRKQLQIDQTEIENIYAETAKNRLTALQFYMKALGSSDKYDLFIFRVIALWLNKSPSDEGAVSVSGNGITDADRKILDNPIQSYKYIAVLHQLSARLGTRSKATSEVLETILLKCAEDHPYHALPVILTQSMLHKDRQMSANKSPTSSRTKDGGEERATAAGTLVAKLKKNKKTGALTVKMGTLWNALISFAYHKDEGRGMEKKKMPDCDLKGLKDLSDIPVLTVNIPVKPSGDYKILGIKEFGGHYQLVGGINAPKKISCKAVNGQAYNMLLKGNDDLRQDAVMQQVFGVINQLLEADPKTKKKRLIVRTYKVVPLSQRSGVLEWCENTQTFGEYLVGSDSNPGAHVRYRPKDYTPHECRRMMLEVKDSGDNKKKHDTFKKIMDQFKPVFHHFFFENFRGAGSFFERRLAYTRSVATSSIVGYILGLGDRHVLNILIDKKTAEVIHIDLGVAFEQGRLLPTPETIPFRLTRDVVDGFGFCGTEGVFRRSCEDTMDVLRKNADIILTILEVLLYDPLYLWTLTEDRKRKLQPMEKSQVSSKRNSGLSESDSFKRGEQNNTAAGELRRLKCKLAGIQEGRTSGSTISVPGHVAQLINNAMDTSLLSRLFPGWQPYL